MGRLIFRRSEPLDGLSIVCHNLDDRIGGDDNNPEIVIFNPTNYLNLIEYRMSFEELKILRVQIDKVLKGEE